MIGLDTSAIIDIFRGDEKIKQFLENNKDLLKLFAENVLYSSLSPKISKIAFLS